MIFDLGAHKGEDSAFYLSKGFKVVAVDASDKLCEFIAQRFRDHANKDDFKIVNFAITEKDNETITFYENNNSVWSTILDSWDFRNKTQLSTISVKKNVQTIRLDTLIKQELQDDETLEYVKIDIEGADTMALRSLSGLKGKPRFISIESEKLSWEKLLAEFDIFRQLGYTKFKVVDQSKITDQKCPYPAREGNYIDYSFEEGSTGLFGDELPGEWLSADDAISVYKKIFVRYKYFGDYGIFNNKFFMKNRYLNKLMSIFKLRYPHAGWYDTHASF